MSSGGERRNNAGGGRGIPAASRKMAQHIKEIVDCPEAEIYAMLKECNMDPSEAVNRLLNQDTFHEVKSKREKKKETKEPPESWSRTLNSSSTRGSRGLTDRAGRSNATQFSSHDDVVSRSKPLAKKENGPTAVISSSILGPAIPPTSVGRRPPVLNNPPSLERVKHSTGIADGVPFPSQPSVVPQQSWVAPGQVTMADIVKRGRPRTKPSIAVSTNGKDITSNVPMSTSGDPFSHFPPLESNHGLRYSCDPIPKAADVSHESVISSEQQTSLQNWSFSEDALGGSGWDVPEASDTHVRKEPHVSDLSVDRVDMHLNSLRDEIQVIEGNSSSDSLPEESITPASSSDKQENLDSSGDASHSIDSSFQIHRQAFDQQEVEDVYVEISSAAGGIKQLSLHKEDLNVPSITDHPAVIIPDHLQVTNAECSHLSFGSFGSGVNASFSGSSATKPLKSNLDMVTAPETATLVDQQDTRSSEHYDNEQLRPISDNVVESRASSSRDYEAPSISQAEVVRNDSLDASDDPQFNIPSISGYSLPSTTKNVTAYAYSQVNSQVNSQMQNLASFASLLQNNSLTSTLPPARNFDLPFSTFLTTQSTPTKYSTSVSSVSGSTISVPEPAKQYAFYNTQPTPQPSTSIPVGSALPQHVPVHPYSQTPLPLDHFANMISYPFLPPSYSYMPSATFQQTYTGNGAIHQLPVALQSAGIKYNLPQYKSNISVTSLPQAAAIAPGYGGFGSSSTIHDSYILNPTPSPSSTIDEALSSQYKEANQFVLQHNDNHAMWLHGAGSRTMPPGPPSTFYSFLGQNQQGGFRQSQQLAGVGNLGYPNFYHQSQAGVSQVHQQNPSEANLNGSEAQSQQSHQIWQHSY